MLEQRDLKITAPINGNTTHLAEITLTEKYGDIKTVQHEIVDELINMFGKTGKRWQFIFTSEGIRVRFATGKDKTWLLMKSK